MVKEDTLRTPDSRFENLQDYDFRPFYFVIDGYRIHYLDEGEKNAPPILLLHGEPSWSFLYRKMIPILVEAGFRVVVPDLLGFGRSDKPINTKAYSYQLQVDMISELVRGLDLQDITFFGHDWGGLIGLRVVAEDQKRFARIAIGNSGLPAEKGIKGRIAYTVFKIQVARLKRLSEEELIKDITFLKWVAYTQKVEDLPIGEILQKGTVTELSPEVIKAYEAPFPDASYKTGAKIMPKLVASQLIENQKAWDEVFSKWKKPFLLTFSDSDPITEGGDKIFLEKIPGTKKQKHVTIKKAGHFLQEDKGEQLARILVKFIKQKKIKKKKKKKK
ncbi:MAG: haloalkane dehalogenase [Candidatus Heimdallarchaeota archaeon]|nr:haloalkane dehalogenase [Candidatus Heimdallarchaeota archaeon]